MSFSDLTQTFLPPLPPYITITPTRISYNGTTLQEYYHQYFIKFYDTSSHLLNLSSNYSARYPEGIGAAPPLYCECSAISLLKEAGLIVTIGILAVTPLGYYCESRIASERAVGRAEERGMVIGREEGILMGKKRGREEGLVAGRALRGDLGDEGVEFEVEVEKEEGFRLLSS